MSKYDTCQNCGMRVPVGSQHYCNGREIIRHENQELRDALHNAGVWFALHNAGVWFARYRQSEGCDCCRDTEQHKINEAALAEIFKPPQYGDGSGWDWKALEDPNE